jgi:Tfp pilus assembly protein PilZ
MDSTEDKELYKRLKVELKGIKGEMAFAKDVEIIDISVGGISLKSSKKLSLGSEHMIELKHKDKVIFVKSRVVWSFLTGRLKDLTGALIPIYTVGMQFIDVPNEIINEIAHFIEEHKEEEDKIRHIYVGSEQRHYVRYNITASAKAKLAFSESCEVKVLSIGGMLIESEHAQEIGNRLQMQLFLSEDEFINLLGRVSSCRLISDRDPEHFDIGVEFLEMSEQDEDVLKAFVNSLHKKSV